MSRLILADRLTWKPVFNRWMLFDVISIIGHIDARADIAHVYSWVLLCPLTRSHSGHCHSYFSNLLLCDTLSGLCWGISFSLSPPEIKWLHQPCIWSLQSPLNPWPHSSMNSLWDWSYVGVHIFADTHILSEVGDARAYVCERCQAAISILLSNKTCRVSLAWIVVNWLISFHCFCILTGLWVVSVVSRLGGSVLREIGSEDFTSCATGGIFSVRSSAVSVLSWIMVPTWCSCCENFRQKWRGAWETVHGHER